MSTVAEKITYLNDTKSAIKNALIARGVSVSNSDTFRSYADKIGEIGETVVVEKETTKYGISINALLGDVDENGILHKPSDSPSCSLDLSTVQALEDYVLYAKFSYLTNISSVNLGSLTFIGAEGMHSTFKGCRNLIDVNLSSLQTIGSYGLAITFEGCVRLTNIDLSSLQSASEFCMNGTFSNCFNLTNVDLHSLVSVDHYGFSYMFSRCTALESVDLSSLTSVGIYGFNGMFYDCVNLVNISFPALKNIQNNSFVSMFDGCTALTEIHFRADMQETIEAMEGYSEKWGASNATIYFDL